MVVRRAFFQVAVLLALILWWFLGVAQSAGNNLVFVQKGDIWIATSDGANPHQLTFTGQASSPALSPNGKQVAFLGPGQKANRSKIFLISTEGGKIRALNLPDIDDASSPSFSPDGTQLLFRGCTFGDNNNTVSFLLANFSDFSLRKIMSIGGLDDVEADNMVCPAFSPDGRLIVYNENGHEPTGGFTIIALTGKQVACFPFNPKKEQVSYSYLNPKFSPDGQEILAGPMILRKMPTGSVAMPSI